MSKGECVAGREREGKDFLGMSSGERCGTSVTGWPQSEAQGGNTGEKLKNEDHWKRRRRGDGREEREAWTGVFSPDSR